MLGNFKIKVNNEFDAKEIQKLFEKIGYSSGHFYVENFPRWVGTEYDEYWYTTGFDFSATLPNHEELTLHQLRDLVVLHRNDIQDANWVTEGDDHIYQDSNGKSFIFREQVWDELQSYEMRQTMWKKVKSKPQAVEPEQVLISGADAKLAWAKGECVEYSIFDSGWYVIDGTLNLCVFDDRPDIKFRLKPRTITLNVDIPTPFKPKVGEFAFYLDGSCKECFDFYQYDGIDLGNPLWRSSEEIKQVVKVLSSLKNSIKGVDDV